MSEALLAPVIPGVEARPLDLFLAGAMMLPAFLLQQDIVIRGALVVLFAVLNALSGRKVRLAQSAAVAAAIVVFNLAIPTGRILASPLGLAITEGALKSGLMKAAAMVGLIHLSQFSIRAPLRLPGRVGSLVGRCLFYFEAIMSQRRAIDPRNLVGSIDAILLSLTAGAQPSASGALPTAGRRVVARREAVGRTVLAAVVSACWAALIERLVDPRPLWGG